METPQPTCPFRFILICYLFYSEIKVVPFQCAFEPFLFFILTEFKISPSMSVLHCWEKVILTAEIAEMPNFALHMFGSSNIRKVSELDPQQSSHISIKVDIKLLFFSCVYMTGIHTV